MPDSEALQAALDAPADPNLTPEADSAAVDKLMGVLDDNPAPAPAPAPEPAPEAVAAPAEETPAEPAPEEPAPELTDKSLLSEDEKPAEEEAPKPAEEEAPKPEEPKAEEKAPEPEPEKPYEIELPEGLKAEALDKEVFDKFKNVMAESKVPPEKAKEILAFYQNEMNKAVSTTFEKANEQFARLKDSWRKEAIEAIGPNRIETAMRECNTVLNTYIKDEGERSAVRKMLGETGLGNNLRFLNFLQNIYNQNLREGSLSSSSEVRTAQRGSPQNTSELANVLFDN